jgi:hypothetical protein
MKRRVKCTAKFIRKHYQPATNTYYALINNVDMQGYPESKDHYWVKWNTLWEDWFSSTVNIRRIKAQGCMLQLKGQLQPYTQEYAKGKLNLIVTAIQEMYTTNVTKLRKPAKLVART